MALDPNDVTILARGFYDALAKAHTNGIIAGRGPGSGSGGSGGRGGSSWIDRSRSLDENAKQIIQQRKLNRAIEEFTDHGVLNATKALKHLVASGGNINQVLKLTNAGFSDLRQTLSDEKLDDVIKKMADKLKKSSNAQVQHLGTNLQTQEDFARMELLMRSESLSEAKKLYRKLDIARRTNNAAEQRALEARIRSMGLSTHASNSQLRGAVREIADAFAEVSDSTKKIDYLGAKFTKLGKDAVSLSAAFVMAMKPLVDTTRSAAKHGTSFSIIDAIWAGMSPNELHAIQAEHKRVTQSANMSTAEFDDLIRKGTMGLITFTSSLKDANLLNAESFNMARVLGTEHTSFIEHQSNLFKQLNRVTSLTVDQFIEMNKQLVDSEGVQQQIYRINVQQRAAYIKDLQNAYVKLSLDGLLHNQATKVVDVLSQIGAKSPRERLKEAAKLQAVMGAFGMGREGAEAATLVRRGLRNSGDSERMAELMKTANITIGERMGRGFASELVTSTIIEAAGIGQYLGPGSDFSALNTRQTVAIEKSLNQLMEGNLLGDHRNKYLERLLTTIDLVSNFFQGPLFKAILGIGVAIAAVGGVRALGKLGALGAGASGFRAGFFNLALKPLPVIGSIAAGTIAGLDAREQLKAESPELTDAQVNAHATSIGAGTALGSILMGAATGAVIGTSMSGPLAPFGAAAGLVIGGIAGGILGNKAGDMIGEQISDSMEPSADKIQSAADQMRDTNGKLAAVVDENTREKKYANNKTNFATAIEAKQARYDQLHAKWVEMLDRTDIDTNNSNAILAEMKQMRRDIQDLELARAEREARIYADERTVALATEAGVRRLYDQNEKHHKEMVDDNKGYRYRWVRASRGTTSAVPVVQ